MDLENLSGIPTSDELPWALGFRGLFFSVGVEITGITIASADRQGNVYTGNLTYVDHIEHGIGGDNDWEAKPGKQEHKIHGRTYRFDVNPVYRGRVPFWGKDNFTLSEGIDNGFRHAIMHAILLYNPDLLTADNS